MKPSEITRILLILLSSTIILGFVIILTFITSHNILELVQDIATIAKVHPVVGILNNFGVILWCSASAICFFAAFSFRNFVSRKWYAFMLSSGLLSSYLLLDDLFLFHEFIAPVNLGIDQRVIYLFLLLVVIAYLLVFYKIILRTRYIYLLLSGGLLALSMFIDTFLFLSLQAKIGLWEHFVEDSVKWLGIVFWLAYFADTAFQIFRRIQTADE